MLASGAGAVILAGMPQFSEGIKYLILGLSVPGLYCLLVLAGRHLKRRHGVRIGFLYHLFAAGLSFYLPAVLLDLPWPALRHVGSAVVVLAATVLASLLDRYLWEFYFLERHGVRVPKFLTELCRIALLVGAVFLVLQVAYDQSLKGLLIAPGLAAVVLGFAAQDLMGNIVSGLSLQVGKPFVHGDWLFIDRQYAEVIEINWRSTRLRTNDDICIEIPNREISKLTIVNLNRPERCHAMRLSMVLDADAPPSRVKQVLREAAAQARGVAPAPPPQAFLKDFAAAGMEYEIKFYMTDFKEYSSVCDAIRTNAWYALRRHHIDIPFPSLRVRMEHPAPAEPDGARAAARKILASQPLFACLSPEQLDSLVPADGAACYGAGERVIIEGSEAASMFILVAGQAVVTVGGAESARRIAELRAGDCFGEMSLLTGERRSATVVAGTDCVVVEIHKEAVAAALRASPELLTQLGGLLAQRQMQTEGAKAAAAQDAESARRHKQYAATFATKLRRFFEM